MVILLLSILEGKVSAAKSTNGKAVVSFPQHRWGKAVVVEGLQGRFQIFLWSWPSYSLRPMLSEAGFYAKMADLISSVGMSTMPINLLLPAELQIGDSVPSFAWNVGELSLFAASARTW